MNKRTIISIASIGGSVVCAGLSAYDGEWMATFAWVACTVAYWELHQCWKLIDELLEGADED